MSEDSSEKEPVVPTAPEPEKKPSPYDRYAEHIKDNSGYRSIFQSDTIGTKTDKTK